MTTISYDTHDVQTLSSDTRYSVTIANGSQMKGQKALIFQKQPNLPSDVRSLAWLVKTCHPSTRVSFFWNLQFSIVWGQEGQLKPGVNYQAGQMVEANLVNRNAVQLQYIDNGFTFGPVGSGTKGSLFVNQDNNVPGSDSSSQGCVGIGMSGAGTFVVPTEPGYRLEFKPEPQYWIALGIYNPGEVVDQSGMTDPVRLKFTSGNFNANCQYSPGGWDVTYS